MANGGDYGTEVDEMELGRRVAVILDAENNCWGAASMLWWYAQEEQFDGSGEG